MGNKAKRNRAARGSKGGEAAGWSASDHAVRQENQQSKRFKGPVDDKTEAREARTALLTRGSKDKIADGKLRLNITIAQKAVDKMKLRLEGWDDQEEKRLVEEQPKQQQKDQERAQRKKGRLGPESWKLKGAARPAWQVCEDDTRYVDVHLKAHEEAKKKAARIRNLMVIYKGKFGQEGKGGPPQPFCRQYLAMLMKLGILCMEAKKYKTARLVFLECLDLDGVEHPITLARSYLMRLYLEVNRPNSARQLWENRLLPDDKSVWVRYSAVLVEYISWKIQGEEGSSSDKAEQMAAKAIKANVFCAFHLAFFQAFHEKMHDVEGIMDVDDAKPLESAIEYCSSEQLELWQETEGALSWFKGLLLRAFHGDAIAGGLLSFSDLDWPTKLQTVQEEYRATLKTDVASAELEAEDEPSDADEDEADFTPSVLELSTMFRSAMEALFEAGALAASS